MVTSVKAEKTRERERAIKMQGKLRKGERKNNTGRKVGCNLHTLSSIRALYNGFMTTEVKLEILEGKQRRGKGKGGHALELPGQEQAGISQSRWTEADVNVGQHFFLKDSTYSKKYWISAEFVCQWESSGNWEVCRLFFFFFAKRWKWDSS